MASIIVKGSDKVLVLATRESLVYPAVVPNWLDVRIGAFVSITKTAADDDPTGLAETVTTTGNQADRLWLGAKENNNAMPHDCNFFGISNSPGTEASQNTILDSIDTNFRWRAKHATVTNGLIFSDGTTMTVESTLNPFRTIQAPASLGGNYATLVLLRMVRSVVGNTVDHFYVAKTNDAGTDYADAGVETATPTIDLIRANFNSATWTEVLAGPKIFTAAPDAFYAYWPFVNSRLRIHAIVVEKFA
jgi:hypothetical protein